jgi:hypothetical protein
MMLMRRRYGGAEDAPECTTGEDESHHDEILTPMPPPQKKTQQSGGRGDACAVRSLRKRAGGAWVFARLTREGGLPRVNQRGAQMAFCVSEERECRLLS